MLNCEKAIKAKWSYNMNTNNMSMEKKLIVFNLTQLTCNKICMRHGLLLQTHIYYHARAHADKSPKSMSAVEECITP
jgi:hypothetical protein